MNLSENNQKELKCLAKNVIQNRLDGTLYTLPETNEIYSQKFGIFVSLNKKGKLRGCVGYISGYKGLLESIKDMALRAAFSDERFSNVTLEELNDIYIEISILTPLERVESTDEIVVGEHGLYVENEHHSGILLPQVATEYKLSKEQFIKEVCTKAGLDSSLLGSFNFYKFKALVF